MFNLRWWIYFILQNIILPPTALENFFGNPSLWIHLKKKFHIRLSFIATDTEQKRFESTLHAFSNVASIPQRSYSLFRSVLTFPNALSKICEYFVRNSQISVNWIFSELLNRLKILDLKFTSIIWSHLNWKPNQSKECFFSFLFGRNLL